MNSIGFSLRVSHQSGSNTAFAFTSSQSSPFYLVLLTLPSGPDTVPCTWWLLTEDAQLRQQRLRCCQGALLTYSELQVSTRRGKLLGWWSKHGKSGLRMPYLLGIGFLQQAGPELLVALARFHKDADIVYNRQAVIHHHFHPVATLPELESERKADASVCEGYGKQGCSPQL